MLIMAVRVYIMDSTAQLDMIEYQLPIAHMHSESFVSQGSICVNGEEH